MDIETPGGKSSEKFSQRYAAYLLSACLHAVLACVVWTMFSEHAKVADIVQVEIVELGPIGHIGSGQLTGSPAPADPNPGFSSTDRQENRPESLTFETREPEPVSKTFQQDIENTDSKAASEVLHVQETKNTLLAGGFQGGVSDGKGDMTKGGAASDGQGVGGKGQGSQKSGDGLSKSDFQEYQAAVRARIEAAKQYPIAARKRHLEGDVVVSFRLSRKGSVITVGIVKSSGIDLLEKAALSAIQDGAPYPTYPTADNEIPPSMTVNISFILK